jgi:hypothetical protein
LPGLRPAMAPRAGLMVCSDRCAKRERRARRRRERQAFCAMCYGTFGPRRSDAKFCGNACRQRAYRRRKAVEAEAARRRKAAEAATEAARLAAARKSADFIASLIG